MGTWTQAGEALRRLRQSRGWGLGRLALVLEAQARRAGQSVPSRESLVRMVRMWEAGSHRPRDYYELFILAYATEEELSSRTAAPGSDLERLMAALEAMGLPMDRRNFLLNSAALAVGAAVEPPWHSLLDVFDDDPVQAGIGRLGYLQELQRSGAAVEPIYRLLVRHANHLGRLTTEVAGSHVEGELHAVEARTLAAAGWIAFAALGRHAAAEEHLHAGARAARQSSDLRLRAKLLADLAARRVYDPTGDARTNLYDALCIVNSGARYADGDPFVLTDLLAWQAFIHASLDNEHRVRETLEQASATIEHARSTDKPEWLPEISLATVQETAGCCHLRLGKPRAALEEITHALVARRGDGDHRSAMKESQVLTWGSQASAGLNQPEHAVSLLQDAIPVASASGDALRLREIRGARAMLRRWDGQPFVEQLDQQMRTAGIAA